MQSTSRSEFRNQPHKLNKQIILLFVHISAILAAFYLYQKAEILWVLVAWILSVVVFGVLKGQWSFPALIAFIIGYGFYSFLSLVTGHNTDQLLQILKHISVLVGGVSLWTLIYLIRGQQNENNKLVCELNEIRKFEPVTKVLTPNEFMYRFQQIRTNIKRYSSDAYIIIVKTNPMENYKMRVVTEAVGCSLVDTVRENYDIVTMIQNGLFVVTLQKCEEQGLFTVVDRFKNNLKSKSESFVSGLDIFYKEFNTETEVKLEDFVFDKEDLPKGVTKYE